MSCRAAGIVCAVLVFLGAVWGSDARAVTITFDELATGEFVDTQYQPLGVTISAVVRYAPDVAITFDSQGGGATDPDLQGPMWSGGNLAASAAELSKILILPRYITDADGDGLVDDPNDQGRRPAGYFTFDFAQPIVEFGLDLVDIEPERSELGTIDFFSQGALVGTIAMADLPLLVDPTIVFGNNTANHVRPITAQFFGVGSFDSVVVTMGGSGAVDNITFTMVPEPGTLLMLGLGLTGLVASRRGGVWRARPRRP